MSPSNWRRLRNTGFAIMERIEPSYLSLALMAQDILAIPSMLVFISVTSKHYS